MRYIRTKNNQILDLDTMEFDWALPRENFVKSNAAKEADTIEDLIVVGDLVVWYNASSKRDEYFYIHDKDELFVAKHYPIKQVFTQTNGGREFKLVITANDKGELELL